MEKLVERARATMNVILAGVALWAWVEYAYSTGPIDVVHSLYEHAAATVEILGDDSYTKLDPAIQEFLEVDIIHFNPKHDSKKFIAAKSIKEVKKAIKAMEPAGSLDAAAMNALVRQFQITSTPKEEEVAVQRIIQRVKSPIADLKQTFENYTSRVDLPDEATVGELHRRIEKDFNFSVLNNPIPRSELPRVATLSFLVAMIYLVSIVVTIRRESEHVNKREGCDWVFFHAGWLGPAVGALWVLTPAAMVFFFQPFGTHGALSVVFIVTLLVLGLTVLLLAIVSRIKFNAAILGEIATKNGLIRTKLARRNNPFSAT